MDGRLRIVGAGLALLVLGCDGESGVSLFVDLRTDLVPGVEFAAVRTQLLGRVPASEMPGLRGQMFIEGRRVGEFVDVPLGNHDVEVALLDDSGRDVVSRRVSIDVSETAGITVVISRECRSLSCPSPGDEPSRTQCLAGGCVPPSCAGEGDPDCPPVECAMGADCESTVTCAISTCAGGVCLYEAGDERCGAGERCDPDVGCVADTSPPDAGALDDAGTSTDGGTLDAWSPADAGPPNLVITLDTDPVSGSAPLGDSIIVYATVRNAGGGTVTGDLSFELAMRRSTLTFPSESATCNAPPVEPLWCSWSYGTLGEGQERLFSVMLHPMGMPETVDVDYTATGAPRLVHESVTIEWVP